jgi:hypothetical protein
MTDSPPRPDDAVSEGRLMLKRYFKEIRDSQHGRCADCGQTLADGSQTLMRENKDETYSALCGACAAATRPDAG